MIYQKFSWIFALMLIFPTNTVHAQAESREPLLVFAAASLKDVMEEISNLFETRFKERVIISFASSSALARQLEHGAPADVYISADVEWMNYLKEREIIQENSIIRIASNSLVVVGMKDLPQSLKLLKPDVFDRVLGENRLALADPSHVPAGRYGKVALESLGIWQRISDRIIPAENVRVALALVSRGEVSFGIVYASDVKNTQDVKTLVEIPLESHPPVLYPAAVVKNSNSEIAEQFVEFLNLDESQFTFKKHGFGSIK